MSPLIIAQIAISVALVAVILLQQRGTAIGSFMGGGGGGESYSSRRGIEKYLLWATVVLLVVFIGMAITNLVLLSQ